MTEADNKTTLAEALGRVFGFHSFRPNQQDIIQSILDGRDVFAVMPTGGGKSLCYQLPAHLLDGTGIIVSPLISLMKDQVDAAKANGLAAEFLNSSLDDIERDRVIRELSEGKLDLLYVAPERFPVAGFIDRLRKVKISLFAIDEAHCISEWGHDFRPDYLELSAIAGQFPNVPVAAFTATATERVQNDIIERLKLRNPHSVRASFDRPNLFYRVEHKHNLHKQLLGFLDEHPDEAGIVYRTSRKNVEKTADFLVGKGLRALPYHAGLDPDVRRQNQEAFNRDEIDIIVATIAFGMGIDKSNIRFVIHGDLPRNIESYYQETGRSGRDGEQAQCVLFFSSGDIFNIRYFIDQVDDKAERMIASRKLSDLVSFATANGCKRRQLLAYFGEEYADDNCDGCDVCRGTVEQVDATTDAQIVMSAIARTGERFGVAYVVDVIAGADTERIRALNHDRLKTYGIGKERKKTYWRRIIDDLIVQGCVVRSKDEFRVLSIAPKGREVLFGSETFHVLKQREPDKKKRKRKSRARQAEFVEDYDHELFEKLRALRTRIARKQGVPPYIVFSDRTLHEMAAVLPASLEQMREITGIGDKKLKQYGEEFLSEIRSYGGSSRPTESHVRTDDGEGSADAGGPDGPLEKQGSGPWPLTDSPSPWPSPPGRGERGNCADNAPSSRGERGAGPGGRSSDSGERVLSSGDRSSDCEERVPEKWGLAQAKRGTSEDVPVPDFSEAAPHPQGSASVNGAPEKWGLAQAKRGTSEDVPVPDFSQTEPHTRDSASTPEATWLLAKDGRSYLEIAEERGIPASMVSIQIERLILDGRDVDVANHVDSAKRLEIERLFSQLPSADLRKVVEESNGSVTFAEARLVRADMVMKGDLEG